MEYKISRTSSWSGAPHKDAYQREYIYVDARTTDDPKKIPANCGTDGDWYQKGTNHRVENGRIKRDIHKESGWFIQINDLHKFLENLHKDEKATEIILSIEEDINPPMLGIEIYDDYRE